MSAPVGEPSNLGSETRQVTRQAYTIYVKYSYAEINLQLYFCSSDPMLKARIKEQLAKTQSPHYVEIESPINIYDYSGSGNTGSPKHQRQQHNKGATTPTNSGSPALRYKSPTHLPSLRQNSPTTTATTTTVAASSIQQTTSTIHTHSRNSSASSTKIQMVESTTITTSVSNSNIAASPTSAAAAAAAIGGDATSPTFRPSRIPQALKAIAPKSATSQVQSPQHKRPRPSQIPTKASNGNGLQPLQSSNSYSGSPAVTRQQRHSERDTEPEPHSAPPQPAKAPRFEAYMMTGDLMLNLSRTPQSSNLLTAQAKKVFRYKSILYENIMNILCFF